MRGYKEFYEIKDMSTLEIIDILKSLGIKFEIERFKEQSRGYIFAEQLVRDFYRPRLHMRDEDEGFILFAIIELWNRLMPERINIEMIDDVMQAGYEFLENDEREKAIEKWEETWKMIKVIVPREIRSVSDADEFIRYLLQCIYNWCQDFEEEFEEAGLNNISYYQKRIDYCHEFCEIFPDSDDSIIQNMLRAEAESHFELGEVEIADNLFQGLVKRFPRSIWSYVGWGDTYCDFFHHKNLVDYDKAEGIYRLGLAKCDEDIEILHERINDLKDMRGK
jgi:tetratricopeptide (TPR) repeat protein